MPVLVRFLLVAALATAPAVAQPQPSVRPSIPASSPLIVLMTDYGTKDFYAGALHGSIYSVCPRARVDVITHEVTQFDIQEGAYTILQAAREFPPGTIFVASVDPGVGTVRKVLLLHTRSGHTFIGPDNGVLTLVMDELKVDWVREITSPDVMRRGGLSHTFHGRDVFGPAAASLACGVPPEAFGPIVKQTSRLPIAPLVTSPGEIRGGVLVVDHYGNLITNIPAEALIRAGVQVGQQLSLTIGDRQLKLPFVSTYADVTQGKPLGLIASAGYLELALNMGNLAGMLGVSRNAPVRITLGGP